MPQINTAHIISHTHWDREWYLNSPYTNAWLAPFFKSLFAMLEKEPEYRFVLDGQTSMIEDWLQVLEQTGQASTPQRERLSHFVRAGRVCVGPYYLQPDWQLVSEESLIRNLLIGRRMARQLGGRMNVGWLLDNFGQVSQTVQIHCGFGLNGLFVWRGIEMSPDEIKSEFTWEAPDGSQATAIYLVGSYRNGMRLAEYRDSMRGRIAGEIKKLAPFASTSNILLMNGYDQEMLPDDILPALRSGLNRVDEVQVVQSTPQEYLDAVVKESPQLPVLRGALYSGRYISVFPGILSSRIYLKIQNDACERALAEVVEPLSAVLWGLGDRYPAEEIDRSWRVLLKNQPHDSICGVSVDDVHTDMEERFAACEAIADQLKQYALARLISKINTSGQAALPQRWVVINTDLHPRAGLVELRAVPQEAVAFMDGGGHGLPVQRNPDGSVVVGVGQIPALGYSTVSISEPQPDLKTPFTGLHVDREHRIVENVLIRICVEENGTLTLTDKVNGASYRNQGLLEDGGDAGDTYNYSYPVHDRIITTQPQKAVITFLETGPLRARIKIDQRMKIPKSLTHDRKNRHPETIEMPISTLVTIQAGAGLVSFQTTVSNFARDHRLRVLFPTQIRTDKSYAETQADVASRPITPLRYDDSSIPPHVKQVIIGAREPEPITTFPQRGFVDLSDGKRGVAVLNRGLPEFEILPEENTIALTLFRGVGWIARPDLLTRIGDAGPLIATPGAQCLRKMVFHYGLLVHGGDWQSGQVIRQAGEFNHPLIVVQTDEHAGKLPPHGGFLTLDDPGDQLRVTAVKRSEDGNCLAVRFFNPSDARITARVWSFFRIRAAQIANLAEEDLESIEVDHEHEFAVVADPKRIVTLRLDIEPSGQDATQPQQVVPSEVISGEPLRRGEESDAFASISPDEIAAEANRAANLHNELEIIEQDLRSFLQSAEGQAPSALLERYQRRLAAASLRRTALEARLSETMLKKNARLEQLRNQPVDPVVLSSYRDELKRIGDEINLARVEKRALEYVVDYYTKQNASS